MMTTTSNRMVSKRCKSILHQRLALAALGILILLCPATSLAQWTDDTNTNTRFTALTTDEWNHHTVSDGLGGTITSLNTFTTPGDYFNFSAMVQRLDGDGLPVWGPDGVVLAANSDIATDNQVVSDGAGGAFVAWISKTPTGTKQAWAQHVGATGTTLWSAGGVDVCDFDSDQDLLQMVSDGAGGVIIAWRDVDGGFLGVYAQRIDSAGNILWNPGGNPANQSNLSPIELKMASGSDPGTAVLTWTATDGLDRNLKGQILDATGLQVIPELSMNLYYDSTNSLSDPGIASDGAGGFFAVWKKTAGTASVLSRHILADGSPDGASVWLGGMYPDQIKPQIVSDGIGGAFVQIADVDFTLGVARLCLHHLVGIGSIWGNQGVHLTNLNSTIYTAGHYLAADGAGGLYSSWRGSGVYGNQVQHTSASGTPLWPADRPGFTSRDLQYITGLVPDDNGNLIVAFGTADPEFFQGEGYAQRLDVNGYPTDTAFAALTASDRPNDQGGEVVLTWQKSPLDGLGSPLVANYSYWVRLQAAKVGANAAERLNIMVLPDTEVAKLLKVDAAQLAVAKSGGWTYAGLVPAIGAADYSAFCPTYGDSTDVGVVISEFKVVAHHSSPGFFWEAANILAGYSVDNLSPGAPLNLTGIPNPGVVDLTWTAGNLYDDDLREYRVYRGDFSGFPVDSAHLLSTTTALAQQDLTASGDVWYRVTAVDAHGNQSPPSNEVAVSVGISAVGSVPEAFQFRGNSPNPFNPATHISFDLPRESAVVLEIFSVNGGHVATLVNGTLAAGNHRVLWNGLDSSGRGVASGVYYSRLQTDRDKAFGKMTLVR